MIKVAAIDDKLVLIYQPERDSGEWLSDKLGQRDEHTFRRTFTVTSRELDQDSKSEKYDGTSWTLC